jgi:hypothetical protein
MAFLQKKAYRKQKRTSSWRFAVVAASLAILLFAGLSSYRFYFTESSYMDIDVNPSIELTINRFDRVIGVYAYNEDGQKVLDQVDLRHRSYKDALRALIDKMTELGYIEGSGLFTATLQTKGGDVEKEKLDALKAYIDYVLQTDGQAIRRSVFSVDSTTKSNAHEQNLTPAKYLAILELQKFDFSATFDNCRNHSISEIEQQIHNHRNDSGHGDGNDSGHGGGDGDGATGHHGGSGSH